MRVTYVAGVEVIGALLFLTLHPLAGMMKRSYGGVVLLTRVAMAVLTILNGSNWQKAWVI